MNVDTIARLQPRSAKATLSENEETRQPKGTPHRVTNLAFTVERLPGFTMKIVEPHDRFTKLQASTNASETFPEYSGAKKQRMSSVVLNGC